MFTVFSHSGLRSGGTHFALQGPNLLTVPSVAHSLMFHAPLISRHVFQTRAKMLDHFTIGQDDDRFPLVPQRIVHDVR